MESQEPKTELYYNWISESELRIRLTEKVKLIKSRRLESQKEISKWTNIPLTKIKQLENGTCVDFNAINNYINYLS